MIGRLARGLLLGAVAVFLAAPLVVVAGVSLNPNRRMTFPPDGLSLRWYEAFFADPAWVAAFADSLIVALGAASLALTVALPLCYAVWRHGGGFAKLLVGLGTLAFMLPGVVMAVVFLIFWGALGRAGHIDTVMASHAAVFLALPLLTLSLGFRSIDPALVEAARTLGAREPDVLRTVVWPIVLPYMVCGFAFVFVLSLNEYIIAYMVAGFTVETLPVKVFNSLRMGFSPTMCVGAVLFLLVSLAVLGVIARFGDLPRMLGAGRADAG